MHLFTDFFVALNYDQRIVLGKCMNKCLFSVKMNFTVMGIVMHIYSIGKCYKLFY